MTDREVDRVGFNLPGRAVAVFGGIATGIGGILAGVTRLLCDRVQEAHPEFDLREGSLAAFFHHGWLAAVFLLAMALVAFIVVARPSGNRTIGVALGLGGLAMLLFYVAISNVAWMGRIMWGVM